MDKSNDRKFRKKIHPMAPITAHHYFIHQDLPATNHPSPLTPHHSTTHHSPLYHSTNHHSTTPPITTLPIFISQDLELNASIARYFKYVHHTIITTLLLTPHQNSPLISHQSPITTLPLHQKSPIIIFNEMFIDEDICSLYPLWFAFGLRHHIKVYAFTLGATDFSCNLINWQDFLNLSWQGKFSTTIDFGRVPYFDNTRGHLTGILKPHGGESLYDLAAGFHMTFANASQYIARVKSSGKQVPSNFKSDVIESGIARYQEFQQKEPRHHGFLSMLPEADLLFAAVKELGNVMGELEGTDTQGTDALENLSRLLSLIQAQTSSIHLFFLNLEPFLPRGVQ